MVQLEAFDAEITEKLGGMEEMPREVDIQDHYVRQFRRTNKLQHDVAYFDRLEEGHKDKTWKYLRMCLRRYVFRERADKNEDQLCPPDAIKLIAAGGKAADGGKIPIGLCGAFLSGKCS